MKHISPYLRVVAGFFAAVCTWLTIVDLVRGNFSDAAILLLFAAGLWYLAVGKPLRDRAARISAENAAVAARAQAGHEAFLAGDTAAAFAPPPEPVANKPIRKGVVIASVIAGAFVLLGIVGDIEDGLDDESTAPPSTTAATAAPTTPPSTPASVPTTAGVSARQAPAPSTTTPTAVALMPNVMCMNLQLAQDTIQESGVFFSRSEDATGRDRMQISDRNWVVVGQQPAPGTPVEEGDPLLSVVKYGEPGACS